jgi:predicted DNA-binding mobile mystery protein A
MSLRTDRAALGRRQLDIALDRTLAGRLPARPARGWIAAIRSALGMTTRQLAARLRIRQPSLLAIEKSEVAGTVSLNTLRRAAEALDCDLAYVLVPRRPLEQTVRNRARALAEIQVAATSHSMQLEGQGIGTRERAAEVQRLTDVLMAQGSRLWAEPVSRS